jgi:hypothetical protein
MLKPALRFRPKLAAPKRGEQIPAYIERARTDPEKAARRLCRPRQGSLRCREAWRDAGYSGVSA